MAFGEPVRVTLFCVQNQVAWKSIERIHRCRNLRGKVEEGGSGQRAEMCSWKMCGRTATVLTSMDTHAYRLKQARVESRPVYPAHVCMCELVCAHAALFIRAVNQSRYDITLCETKRGERVRAGPTCFGMSPLVTEITRGLLNAKVT